MERAGSLQTAGPFSWHEGKDEGYSMNVEVVGLEGSVLLLTVRGRITSLTADLFEYYVRRAVAGSDRDVIIDASDVTFLGSAGLRTFLRLWRLLHKKERSLHVCALKPHIRQVFKIIGFDRIIPIQEDRVAAMVAVEARTRSRQ